MRGAMRMAIAGLAVAGALAAPVDAAETDVQGTVESVTVYTAGLARVTRAGRADLVRGTQALRSAPLPPRADPSSVQVTVDAPGTRLESVETRRTLVDEKMLETRRAEHRQELRAQEEAVFDLELALRGVQESIQSRSETIEFVQQMRRHTTQAAAAEKAENRLQPEAWGQAIDLAQQRTETARQEIRELTKKKRGLEHDLAEARRKLSDIRRKSPDADYETRVYATVSAQEPGDAAVRLSYNVPGASWQPAYRAAADVAGKHVRLEVLGAVRQQTGEDWMGVDLKLSTARPDLGTDVPELKPWYLRTAPSRGRKREAEAAGRGAAMDRLAAEPERPAEAPAAPPAPPGVAASGVATVFSASAEVDIPSDDQAHRIAVAEIQTPVALTHVAVPKVLPHAFLHAKGENRAPFPLLAGPVDVVVGGSFVGRGRLDMTAPGEEIELGLGVDESVRVSLRLVEDEVERRHWGNRTATTNEFLIEVTNYGERPANVTVRDQLPISRDPEVEVEYGRSARAALRGAQFPGELTWDFELEQGETETIEFEFTIEYPTERRHQLQMLNAARVEQLEVQADRYQGKMRQQQIPAAKF